MTRLFSTSSLSFSLSLCVLCASVFQSLRLFHSLRALGPDLRLQDDHLLISLDLDLQIVSGFVCLERLVHLLSVRDFATTDFEDTVIGFDAGFLGPSAWHNPLDDHTLLPLFDPHA